MNNKLFIGILMLMILAGGCTSKAPSQAAPAGTLKGFSLSPKSFQAADFTDFFEKAQQAGKIVSWVGDWNEIANENSAPNVVEALSKKYSYIPVIEAQFFTQSSGKLVRNLDDDTVAKYKKSVVEFAEKYKPRYIGLGIEVNILYEKSPDDFEKFVSLYNDAYDAIKAVSPKTKVFTIFQLEKMKGLDGGLFGGVNNESNSQWVLLDRFQKTDIAAFTTYPGLIYNNPSEIPDNYYSEVASHTSKPIAFAEIGWHSSASPSGFESSETEQAEFIKRFFSLSNGLDAEFEIWSFMYDQNVQEPFDSMGLFRADGSQKQAWATWVSGK